MMNPPVLLVNATFELLDAAIADPLRLGRVLGAAVADGWAGFPEALPRLRDSYAESPGENAWGTVLVMLGDPRTLVGPGGYKGAPSGEGVVEIGYAIAPGFRGRGLATEAVRQIVRRACADARVTGIDAHTLARANPSTRVLVKLGFRRIGAREDADVGSVWHWRLRPASDATDRPWPPDEGPR